MVWGRTIQTKKDAAIFTGTESAAQDGMLVSGRLSYDFLGRAVEEYYPTTELLGTQGLFNTAIDPTPPTRMKYDVLDRNILLTNPDGTTRQMAYAFGSDRNGNTQFETTVTDGNGVQRQTYHNVRQLITGLKELNAGGSEILWSSYRYDPLQQLVETADDLGNLTGLTYDNLGRRTSVNTPDTGKTELAYDLAGNVTAKINANLRAEGKEIRYSYDFNRVTDIVYPNFSTNNVSYTYGATRCKR